MKQVSDKTLQALTDIIGAQNILRDDEAMAPYIVELRGRFHTPALAIAIPETIEQLQKLVSWANDNRIGLVPQGGNTGMVGGQVPKRGNEIIVSMAKLNRVRHMDASGGYMCVEAGVTLKNAQKAADDAGLLFPLAIAPQEKAQIGGILSSNAGGLQVLAYGYARQLCLGVEAVMANGSLYQGLSGLKKDNTGYDLSSLLVGAEGTLGIISAATLKLFPKPKGFETAFINLSSPKAALTLYSELLKRLGTSLTTFEMMPDFGMQMQIRHKMIEKNPAAKNSEWYVLAQMSQLPGQSTNALSTALDSALNDRVIEHFTIAKDERIRRQMWKVREQLSGAQSKEGASIKHDISVPISAVPELIERGIEAAKTILPDIRPCPFGHLGDGNIHFNFSQPVGADPKAYMDGAMKIHEAIYGIVTDLGGSISAEHGIGQLKTELLKHHKDPVAYDMMKKIKLVLDPNNIMNPGKLFD
ncbi:MAG: FAD-binding oxidoreductase [Devosiaceae bacterium]|nr:FAD-binding oxidoreductase [Devosiaceae bacterium]